MHILNDSWPVPPEDSANALITIARCPHVAEFGYQSATQRLWWRLYENVGGDAPCIHLVAKQRVQRCVSLHSALGWE